MDIVSLHQSGDGEKYFNVNWALMNNCNYACSYCHPDLHGGRIKAPEFDDVLLFIDQVFEYCNRHKVKPFFEFGGGEVTLLRWFSELIWLIKRRGGLVSIISNASKPLTWWRDNIEALHGAFLSFHVEDVKDKNHFIKVARIIEQSENAKLQANIMMLPKCFDECYEFAKRLKNEVKGDIALQPLYHGFGHGGLTERHMYTPWQDKIMTEFRGREHEKDIPLPRGMIIVENQSGEKKEVSSFDLLVEQNTDFVGWKCNAGIENIVVTFKGDIYRAWCMQDGPIGSIYDPVLSLPLKPTICKTKICQCGADIASTKINIRKTKIQQNLIVYQSAPS